MHVTGLTEIRHDNFEQSATKIMTEIDHYFDYVNESGFPKLALQQAMYNIIRKRTHKLFEVDNLRYSELLQQNPIFKNKLGNFQDHEREIFPNYDDVAQAATHEQDV